MCQKFSLILRAAIARLALLACLVSLSALPMLGAEQGGACCGGAPMTITVTHHARGAGPVLRAITTVQTTSSFTFDASTVTIAVGDTVTWSNSSGITHTSTSDTAVWDSGDIVSGTSYSHTFASAGTFTYHCKYHGDAPYYMRGTVHVVSAPTITSPTVATASLGSPFTYEIVADGATSFNATGLPAGLIVNTTTGFITGTPTASGPFSVSLTASNVGGPGVATLLLTVDAAAAGSPAITSSTIASGVINTAFSYTITATNTPTSFAATGLPTGLSVNTSTGAITGTVTTPSTTDVAITATNASGSNTTTITVAINPLTTTSTSASSGTGGPTGTSSSYGTSSGGCGLGGGGMAVALGIGLLLWRRSARGR